jgi:hypothetical protein
MYTIRHLSSGGHFYMYSFGLFVYSIIGFVYLKYTKQQQQQQHQQQQ